MKTQVSFVLVFISMQATAQNFPTRFKCVSVMNTEIQIQEAKLNEFAMAQITRTKDQEWKLDADVIGNKINSLTLHHLPTGAEAQSDSLVNPLNHLALSLVVNNKRATVDCDLY